MVVVFHEHVGMYLPAGLGTGFRQRFQEALAVGQVTEDGPALVAASHDVVNRVRILDANRPGHCPNSLRAEARQSQDLKCHFSRTDTRPNG